MVQSVAEIENPEQVHYMKPMWDNVLVRPVESPSEKSGIIIPEVAKKVYPTEGTVLDHGFSCEYDWQPGDRVVFSKYAGVEVKFGGLRYYLIKESDFLGILPADAPALEDPNGPKAGV